MLMSERVLDKEMVLVTDMKFGLVGCGGRGIDVEIGWVTEMEYGRVVCGGPRDRCRDCLV